MTLNLDLSPAVESLLKERATGRGMTPEAYAKWLLEGALGLPANGEVPFYLTATPEEWEREFDSLIEEMADLDVPNLPDEAFRRENIYEDRGL